VQFDAIFPIAISGVWKISNKLNYTFSIQAVKYICQHLERISGLSDKTVLVKLIVQTTFAIKCFSKISSVRSSESLACEYWSRFILFGLNEHKIMTFIYSEFSPKH
jgi:hypothetical protein